MRAIRLLRPILGRCARVVVGCNLVREAQSNVDAEAEEAESDRKSTERSVNRIYVGTASTVTTKLRRTQNNCDL